MLTLIIIFAMIFLAGYATQRGSVCAVAAVQEIVGGHRASRFLGFLFCAACALALMAAAELMGVAAVSRPRDLPVGMTTVVGGMVFALGAHVNGKCAFGTVGALGSGELAYAATVIGFVLGAGAMLAGGIMRAADMLGSVSSPLLLVDRRLLALLAGAVTLLLLAALWRGGGRVATAGGWSPLRAMAVIGLANAALLTWVRDWPYTRLLIDLVAGHPQQIAPRATMALVFVAGSMAAASVAGRFGVRYGAPGTWLRALCGGFVMGMGAVLIPGGNDMMLLAGLPLLLPNLSLAYVVTLATLLALETVSSRLEGATMRWPLRKGPA